MIKISKKRELHGQKFDWLNKDPNDLTIARCYVCHKKISLSTAGRCATSDHVGGKKNTDALKKRHEFFNKPK